MHKKILSFILFILFFQIIRAQNELITIWKPSLPSSPSSIRIPYASNENQIWFPGKGIDYTIYWEEVGYPSHHATIQNISSDHNILIDFGTPLNPLPSDATYQIKVINGDGNFQQIQFTNSEIINGQPTGVILGDNYKIVNIEQWGNIKWSSMNNAFQNCENLDVTAIDTPDLSEVNDMSYMFLHCHTLIGNPTFNNWDISNVTNLKGTFNACYVFNQPLDNWNTSKVTSMELMFFMARKFNQPLANWNTSKVTQTTSMFFDALEFNQPIESWDMSSNLDTELMFKGAIKFNQPLGNWNTSNVIDMNLMFNNAKNFNQDISNWNTGNVKFMSHMFSNAEQFNSDISNWNVSKVTNMLGMFSGAKKFNQNLGNWKLNAVQFANNILTNTGLSCENYDNTLYGWSQNPSLPNNINISSASPLIYSHPGAIAARNYLINYKGWTITGDTYNGECISRLGTSDIKIDNTINIYPNPAADIIYIKNTHADTYIILDLAGRIMLKGIPMDDHINIQALAPGNYILQLHIKDNIQNLKFLKK